MNELLRRLLFLPDQASTFARDVDALHYFVMLTTFIMSTAVGLTAIAFFVRCTRSIISLAFSFPSPGPIPQTSIFSSSKSRYDVTALTIDSKQQ